ncbi:hypothetical protein REPUB_Repub05bG0056000 [Reevesia pubescens]
MGKGRFENLVLGIHMGDEVYHKIGLPKSLGDARLEDVCLKEYRETSSIAVIDGHSFSQECHVWVMKEYAVEETWTRLLSIGKLGGLVPEVLGFKRSGELILRTCKGKDVVSYDPKSSEIKSLGIRGKCRDAVVVSHRESLVLIDKGNDVSYGSNVGDSSDESTDDASNASNSSDESTDDSSDESTDVASNASDSNDESTDDSSNASDSNDESTDDSSNTSDSSDESTGDSSNASDSSDESIDDSSNTSDSSDES